MFATSYAWAVALCLSQCVAADYFLQCTSGGRPIWNNSGAPSFPGNLAHAKGAVPISSISWGLGRDVSQNGRVSVSDFSVTKISDTSSATIFSKAVTSLSTTGSDSCVVVLTDNYNGTPVPSMWWTMKTCQFSGYSVSGGGDRPTEELSVNYGSIEMNVANNDKNGKQTSVGTSSYNLPTKAATKRAVKLRV